MFSKKKIIQKTIEVGGFTLLSRFFGIIRVFLLGRYLGATGISDVFINAYKIPNSLRKIFAEGALSAVFIPTIVQTKRTQGCRAVTSLVTIGFLIFEGMVIFLCVIVMLYPHTVMRLIAGGFTQEQILSAVPFLRILMPFIFFLSSSALLAGALQSVGHFFMPAFAPVLLNIVFISALIICLLFDLPIEVLCWFILGGGLLQFIAHLYVYFKLHFGFGFIQYDDFKRFGVILKKFIPCALSMSIVEVSLFIDTTFASYLPEGSTTLIHLANRFMGIPLGVFAVAFSTILLPHFTRVAMYAPKRLRFYLLESTKFVFWITIPVALLMVLFSEKIFYTIFLSEKFTLSQVQQAGIILQLFLLGLFFFSLNKILLNMFYALHVTWVPALIAGGATMVNVIFNYIFLHWLQAPGLALATTISGFVQTVLFLIVLNWKCNVFFYGKRLIIFMIRYLIQVLLFFMLFLAFYYWLIKLIQLLPDLFAMFMLNSIGFWLWICPLSGIFLLLLWYTRKLFGIKLYFLE